MINSRQVATKGGPKILDVIYGWSFPGGVRGVFDDAGAAAAHPHRPGEVAKADDGAHGKAHHHAAPADETHVQIDFMILSIGALCGQPYTYFSWIGAGAASLRHYSL